MKRIRGSKMSYKYTRRVQTIILNEYRSCNAQTTKKSNPKYEDCFQRLRKQEQKMKNINY
ncbi:hypothetical protein LINPERHAP2_LOCUS23476, partial [Linum perenne]